MKEAGGWGSGVRRGFPQNQIPYLSVKGQIGIITMTRRAGTGLWRQLDYQAGWCGGQRELGCALGKCQQPCKAALWGAPGDMAKVRPLGRIRPGYAEWSGLYFERWLGVTGRLWAECCDQIYIFGRLLRQHRGGWGGRLGEVRASA